MHDDLEAMASSTDDGVSVHTGFPNPALDRRGVGPRLGLDLNQLLIKHPSSTYLFRIAGHHWSDQGIYDGDVAVIDRGQFIGPQTLVVIWEASGFHICRKSQLAEGEEPWGAITAVIHQYETLQKEADHAQTTGTH